jgi:uncharacterized membrane protein YecN with MAPEG domain
MVPAIVPVYAAVLAFVYIVLSARVIQARRSAKVAIGTRGDVHLERIMRVHANFAEYVPFALLLATFIEMQGTRAWLIHLLCLALVAGRVVHAYGVSQEHENFRLRMAGMATTLTVLAVMAVWLPYGSHWAVFAMTGTTWLTAMGSMASIPRMSELRTLML